MIKTNSNTKKTLKRTLSILFSVVILQAMYGQKEGKFYATISDYNKNFPVPGYLISNGEYSWSIFGGEKYKVSQDGLPFKSTKVSTFPSDLFTFKENLMRLYKNKSYIVISYGKLCYYALYSAQQNWFYSETLKGDLKRFDSKTFESYLTEYNLLEKYLKDKPVFQSGENYNAFFNREIQWNKKYFDLLNEKIK